MESLNNGKETPETSYLFPAVVLMSIYKSRNDRINDTGEAEPLSFVQ